MKKSFIHFLSLIFFVTFISACVNEEPDVPPIKIPYVDFESNTTLAELKAGYNGVLDSIEDDIIVKGIVVANDESGNFYKTMVIQDETAAIELKLDRVNLYTEFKVGQRVYVKCQGMYLGDYNELLQLGYIFENSIGRLPDAMIDMHLFRDSLPGTPPEPLLITMDEISEPDMSKLVRIDNVYFDETKVPYASPTATTNRLIKDDNDNSLILRTSNYASFAAEMVPDGKGTLVGILSRFGNDNQFYIRDLYDVIDFEIDTTQPVGFTENFTTSLGQFTAKSVTGSQVWVWDGFDDGCAKMSGFAGGSNNANEDWLISPAISVGSVTGEVTISFREAINYISSINDLKIMISDNYDGTSVPTAATWTEVTGFTRAAGNNWTFIDSGEVTLQGYANKTVYVAFKYISTASKSSTWEVGKVTILASN